MYVFILAYTGMAQHIIRLNMLVHGEGSLYPLQM